MGEIINNNNEKRNILIELTENIVKGKYNKKMIKTYRDQLEKITPYDVLVAEDILIKKGLSINNIKQNIEKILNIIGPYLEEYKWDKPVNNHPINLFMQENRKMENILNNIKEITKEMFLKEIKEGQISKLKGEFNVLNTFETHYINKENILFPYLEEVWDFKKPLSVMWSLHDDIRKQLKNMNILLVDNMDLNKYKREFGKLLSLMNRMVFKEEKILFPVAYRSLKENIWDDIYNQLLTENLFLINTEKMKKRKLENIKQNDNNKINLSTGNLEISSLEIILNNLPIEITYVGEDDRVKYFSEHKSRIFPRSKAIIGRKVQNCHPPESVHVVQDILNDFKNGKKDKEHFRIKMKGKFIIINYYALRDKENNYIGTLEVTQDITKINNYKGEKRLLDKK